MTIAIIDLADAGAFVHVGGATTADCHQAACTLTMPRGSSVQLTGMFRTEPILTSWAGSGCPPSAVDCAVTVDTAASVTATFQHNAAFVTPGLYDPGLLGDGDGGVALADAVCNANAANLGLTGHFIAWLSTSRTDAKDRIPPGIRGWVQVSNFQNEWVRGAPFMDRADEGWVLYAPGGWPQQQVATGSTDWGTASGHDCAGWTTSADAGQYTAGNSRSAVPGFANARLLGCDSLAALYCLELDYGVPIAREPVPGALLAFVTADLYAPGGGVAAFDAACALEAGRAGLAGTFKALIATAGVDALGRFLSELSSPVSRLDGVGSSQLDRMFTYDDIPIPVTADGRLVVSSDQPWPALPSRLIGDPHVWTGSSSPSVSGPGTSCVDWLSTAGVAAVSTVGAVAWGTDTLPCDQRARLYCVQSQ